jgi:Tfp pilus assembly protein PilO
MNKPAKNKTEKRIDYKTVSLILFTVAFFGIFAIKPAISLIFTLQKEKSDYEKINQTLETKIQQIIATQAQFMTLINNKDLVEEALPTNHRIEKTGEIFTQKPEIQAFSIQQIQILPTQIQGLNKIAFNVSGFSNYEDLVNFLSYLESSRRLLTLDSLTIEPDKVSSDSAGLNFSSLLNTYYYSP